MSEEPESENILSVDFSAAKKLGRPIERKTKSSCPHLRILIDEDARTVECKQCNKMIDPFTALVGAAKFYELRDYRLDEWQRMKAEDAKRSEARKERWARNTGSRLIPPSHTPI